MDNTLFEINKHKLNILSLSNKLINTNNINEEIFINNELKKETDFLLSLLNIKNNAMMNQMSFNNMNFFNPMMNPNFVNNIQIQQMIQQQLMQMQQMMQQQQIQQEEMLMKQQIENQNQSIDVLFRYYLEGLPKNVRIKCRMKDKVSDVIERYRNEANDRSQTKKFIFNAIGLNPNQTVEEARLSNNSVIVVVETEGVRGG